MSEGKRSMAKPALVGGATILTALVCVCLASLSVLSLMSASSELALAERTREFAGLYYLADAGAQARVAELASEYREKGAVELNDGETVKADGANLTVELLLPIDESGAISVQVEFCQGVEPRITRWSRVFTAEQVFFDDNENLWSGN